MSTMVAVGVLMIFLVMLFSGMEVAFALLFAATVGLIFMTGGPGTAIANVFWSSSNSFILTAIPLFLFMSEVLAETTVAKDMYNTVASWFGKIPGSLIVANVVACGIFAAICGSSVATAAAMGSASIPEMQTRKLDPALSLGSLTAGGTLGILIPPSIAFIVYGYIADTSVGKLFIAGIVPGLMLVMLFTLYVVMACVLNPSLAPASVSSGLPGRWRQMLSLLPFILLIAVVIGVIYSGAATPTEAAGIGAFASLMLALARRELSFKGLQRALLNTLSTTSMVLFIVMASSSLGYLVTIARLPYALSELLTRVNMPGWAFLLAVCSLYLVLGCFLEVLSMLLVTLPFFLPILQGFGFDLIWFGVLCVILNELGLITPPYGLNLFVVQGIAKVKIGVVIRGTLPFIMIMVVALVLIILFPSLATWLPGLMH